MDCVRRLVTQAWEWLPRPGAGSEVVLRHAPSGRVLTDGSPGAEALRFASLAEAAAFRLQYLDEASAWEPIPAEAYESRAA